MPSHELPSTGANTDFDLDITREMPRVEVDGEMVPEWIARRLAAHVIADSGVLAPSEEPVEQPKSAPARGLFGRNSQDLPANVFGATTAPKQVGGGIFGPRPFAPNTPSEVKSASVEPVARRGLFGHQEQVRPAPTIEVTPEVTSEPEERTDPAELDISGIFSSPDSLFNSLNDPNLEPQIKNEVRSLITTWQELQASNVTDEIWREFVLPNIGKLNTQEIKPHLDHVKSIRGELKQLVGKMHEFEGMIGPRANIEEIAEFLSSRHLMGRVDQIDTDLKVIEGDDFNGRMARELGFGTEEAEAKVARLRRRPGSMDLSGNELSNLWTDLEKIGLPVRLKDINGVKVELRGMEKGRNWRRTRDELEDISLRARHGTNAAEEGATSRAKVRLIDGFNMFAELARQQRFGGYEMVNIVSEIIQAGQLLDQELSKSERLYRITEDQARLLTDS